MDSKTKRILGSVFGVVLLYRIIFSDSLISNFETPPGYTPAKSIAQIEADEQKAFEKALAEVSAKDIASVAEIKTVPAELKTTRKTQKTPSTKVASISNKKLAKKISFKKTNKHSKPQNSKSKRVA